MLYNYVDASLMRIKNIDLPEKVIRETMQKRYGEKKRKLDNSIKEHPESVKACEEFGHWVFDSVIGTKGENEPAAITMVERKTRKCIWIKVRNHTADALMEALKATYKSYERCFEQIFKTITAPIMVQSL